MKVLAVDAGNTRVKWGVHGHGAWLASGSVATADEAALGEALGENSGIERVAVANVAGASIGECIRRVLPSGAQVEWVVSSAEQCGVRSSYAEPSQLGADRWAALIGARRGYDGPCVVVNVGTTMTVDALSGDGIFLGGFIVAGFDLMREALTRRTAQLRPRGGSFTFFPDNTENAIASGAVNALAGAVERMVAYMEDTGETDPAIVLSGGNAGLIEQRLGGHVIVVEKLVLEGLVAIATENA